ncbi:ABC-type nitrate/sulfonate/bicarbonate transport systems periplasmic components-like protein [Actinomycetales bacterium JB111]|nr:ABC-type nitrate/sulfonate/bicarbonate transport systems periplasmic components-like protein [Actinomycetales bacterium JB111]
MSTTRKNHHRRIAALAALSAATLALAACGEDSEASTDGLTPLSVALFPAADVAPVYLAIEQGFFEDEGLDVSVQMLDSGAAATAAVVSGDVNIGFSNPASVVIARSQNLPVTIVAPASAAGDTPEDAYSGVLVQADSDIEDITDLEGRTVAVNALGNILEITLRHALDDAGVDSSTVELVEIPFPEMPATLEAGHVDAIFEVEPFVTQTVQTGTARVVATPYELTAPALTGAVYFSNEQFLGENAEDAAAFRRAMEQSVAYADEHPDEMRAQVAEFTEIAPETIDEMNFAQLATDVPREMIELYADLLTQYGLVESEVDIDALMAGLETE